jgi:type II secretory ATPase GspE/PulE/Tfp pilus assembly ATPase PilB-like protein
VTASPILDLPRADFTRIDPRAVALLAERWARRHLVVPLGVDRGTIIVATANPLDLDAERAVAFSTGHRVRWELASPDEIARQLDRVYSDAPTRPDPVAPPVEVQHLRFIADGQNANAADDGGASVIRLVDQLLAEAISAGASDLHLEPEEQGIAVRHRVDGVLRPVRTLPRSVAPSLVSRVKILSGLDIADRMRPQDGRARVAVFGTVVDLRVSTLPVSHGEKIVVRVLDGSAGLRTLESIGFETTTLYAALREIQLRGVNVVTVEDPIEYRLPGVVQVQVHERAGLTFGAALRSIVRQDPDVILVGEIRDRETAEIAIQASLTGHLVLSTLHTNDAASAVTRLIDIGVASYQIATAVKGVVAQRLVRRVCVACAARGCDACEGAGYRGRRAIAEILVSSPEFERRVAAGGSTESLAEAARAGGCISLWESGLTLIRKGETTMEELRRVAAAPARIAIEPPLRPGVASAPLVILWIIDTLDDAVAALAPVEQLRAARSAAELLHGSVVVEELSWAQLAAAEFLPVCNAVVSPVMRVHRIRDLLSACTAAPPLVVALADATPTREDVGILARHADLVVSNNESGRVILASILALLRWRGT